MVGGRVQKRAPTIANIWWRKEPFFFALSLRWGFFPRAYIASAWEIVCWFIRRLCCSSNNFALIDFFCPPKKRENNIKQLQEKIAVDKKKTNVSPLTGQNCKQIGKCVYHRCECTGTSSAEQQAIEFARAPKRNNWNHYFGYLLDVRNAQFITGEHTKIFRIPLGVQRISTNTCVCVCAVRSDLVLEYLMWTRVIEFQWH